MILVQSLLLPVTAAFLAFPFTGAQNAIRLGVIAYGILLIGKAFRLPVVQSGFRAAMEALSHGKGRFIPAHGISSVRILVPILILLAVLPLFLNDYYRDILSWTGIYVVLALGLNIIVGQAGLLNLGYAAFYAVGAYTYAILSTRFGLAFWPGLIAGAAAAAGLAFVLGLATLNLRGDYFAIVTLGLGEITRIVLNNWDSLTGGPNGIAQIGKPIIAGYHLQSTLDFAYLIEIVALSVVFGMYRVLSSRIGRAWIAIREDEIAAEAMGIDTFRLKLLAFVLGSALAGFSGVLFAGKMAFVSPESFTFFESVLILCMVVLGGMGSVLGIVFGAVLLIVLPEIFRDFQDYRMVAFGAALVFMMVFRPQGILGAGEPGKG